MYVCMYVCMYCMYVLYECMHVFRLPDLSFDFRPDKRTGEIEMDWKKI